MVQYIHFRILEFPLKKYRCFLGTPCPPVSQKINAFQVSQKKCQQVLHWIWCLSVYVYVKKTHDTFSTISMSTLFSKHVRNTQALRNIFLSCIFCWKPFLSQNRLKPFESFWAKIHHEFWSMLKHLKQTDTRHRWVPSGTPKNDQVPGAPKAVN